MNIFPNEASEFVYIRTYSRWMEEEKRRETWKETVDRYVDYIQQNVEDRVPQKVFRKIKEGIFSMNVMPSMRALWAAGKAADATNVAFYNCTFCVVNCIEAFSECLYILMCGAGFGFSVQKKYTDKLPIVPPLTPDGAGTFIIPDSKEGWADSVKKLMTSLYSGKDLELDYTLLRPKGARLNTFGGRSSGPAPLVSLHEFIRKVFSDAQGRKLKPIECMDIMNKIAEIVVVGGVRRSSQISFSDLDDKEIAVAKNYPFPLHRSMSNNSAIYEEKPGAVRFLEEWSNLAKSGSGERGISNIQGARKRAPERRNAKKLMGSNPCFTGDMLLRTSEGYKSFAELSGSEHTLININNELVAGKVWSNGIKDTIILKFSNGEVIKCTSDHVFMLNDEASCLAKNMIGNRIMPSYSIREKFGEYFQLGFLQGDGNLTRLKSHSHLGIEVNVGEKDRDIAQYFNINYEEGVKSYYINGYNDILKELQFSSEKLPERTLPLSLDNWTKDQKLDFLAGLYSANGYVLNGKGRRITFKSTCKELILQMSDLLQDFGINSYITTNKTKEIKFSNGEYLCKESYNLNIAQFGSVVSFSNLIGFGQKYKQDALRELIISKSPMVVSIKNGAQEEVFDFTLNDDTHWGVVAGNKNSVGYIAHNCHEIILRDCGMCNLSEVVIRPGDDLDDVLEKIETAVWIGAIQSTFTKFPYLRRKWKNNCEDERLLGVSITGQMDNPKLFTPEAQEAMRKKALKIAQKAAKILGINVPAAITCVKPSGSVSQLVNSSSGLHPRFSRYYIRRYRISSIDPLFSMLKDQGIKMTPENGQREEDWRKAQEGDIGACTIYEKGKRWSEDKVNTWVISFPVKSPTKSICKDELSAIEQLEKYKSIQRYWCEHSASCTVYVKDNEWFEVGNWVYKNWKYITGVSFLPFDGGKYEQAPYEEISKEKYEQLKSSFPKIDYSQLSKFEIQDNTTGSKELACTGDTCELK